MSSSCRESYEYMIRDLKAIVVCTHVSDPPWAFRCRSRVSQKGKVDRIEFIFCVENEHHGP